MKTANIEIGILHNFWTMWGVSMKFPGKVWLMIFLKVAESQSFNLSLEDIFYELTTAAALGLNKSTISLASRFLNDMSQLFH